MFGRKLAKRFWLTLIGVLIFSIVSVIMLDLNLRPALLSIAEGKARAIGVEAINNAAYELMREFEPLNYDALITVVTDSEGHVSMLQANTMKMNDLSTKCALLAQENLADLASTSISIPLGAVTGSQLLAGRGPAVPISLLPVGSAYTEFVSEFTSAGINQTRHRIYIKVSAQVRMVLPMTSDNIQVSTYVQIAESIIVGSVPATYADVTPDNILDLSPSY